jgi:hypothetical protein
MQDMQSMGRYRFFLLIGFTAALLLLAACRTRTDDVIDSNGSAPVIEQVSISPNTVVNTDLIGTQPHSPNDTISFHLSIRAKVVDADGASSISSVPFSIVNTRTQATLAQDFLVNFGIQSDSTSNYSLFIGSAFVSLPRSYIGSLNVLVQGVSTNGFLSSTIVTPIAITRANHAPVIDSIAIPDTVHVTKISSMTITVYASDIDGIDDISGVYQYTQNNTYRLTDNGDGSYSRTITWSTLSYPPVFSSINYIYTFAAYDYSGKASSIITKTIVIVP